MPDCRLPPLLSLQQRLQLEAGGGWCVLANGAIVPSAFAVVRPGKGFAVVSGDNARCVCARCYVLLYICPVFVLWH